MNIHIATTDLEIAACYPVIRELRPHVDDLVTLPTHRSNGFGASLLAWLRECATREGCAHMHLDSGAQRKDANRFYQREGMSITGFHFVLSIEQ